MPRPPKTYVVNNGVQRWDAGNQLYHRYRRDGPAIVDPTPNTPGHGTEMIWNEQITETTGTVLWDWRKDRWEAWSHNEGEAE